MGGNAGPGGDGFKGAPPKGGIAKGAIGEAQRTIDELNLAAPTREKADRVIRNQQDKQKKFDELTRAEMIVQMKDVLNDDDYRIFKSAMAPPGEGPRLHHLGIWVADTDSVLRTCDLLAAAGFLDALERGPGRHGVSNAFYLYMRDPDGHRLELYTYDYFTGDPDFEPIRWSVDDVQRRSFWGHRVPDSWWMESSVVLDLDGRPVPTREPEVVEEPIAAH